MTGPVEVVAAVPSTALPPASELPDAARGAGASRQIVRFLDAMALPAFVAGTAALDAAGIGPEHGARCGLYTVSGWDPTYHQPELELGEDSSFAAVARHYISAGSPLAWLRKMVNNPLCQLSITRGLLGPNNHVVGRASALTTVLTLAGLDLAGRADHMLVVAFDPPPEQSSAHEVTGSAAALVLAPARGRSVRWTWDLSPLSSARNDSAWAVDALDRLIGELDLSSSQLVEAAHAG